MVKGWVEYVWVRQEGELRVNFSIKGANGEHICGSTQGYRDATDARRAVAAAYDVLAPDLSDPGEDRMVAEMEFEERGPGPRPHY